MTRSRAASISSDSDGTSADAFVTPAAVRNGGKVSVRVVCVVSVLCVLWVCCGYVVCVVGVLWVCCGCVVGVVGVCCACVCCVCVCA